jgi:hypothetical protein
MSNTIPSKTYSKNTGKEKRIETVADLPGNRQLSLVTWRNFNGNLVTRASVGIKDGNFIKYLMGRDYNRVFQEGKVRLTFKNVEAQHNKYLEQLDQIAEDATRYYGVSIVKVGG